MGSESLAGPSVQTIFACRNFMGLSASWGASRPAAGGGLLRLNERTDHVIQKSDAGPNARERNALVVGVHSSIVRIRQRKWQQAESLNVVQSQLCGIGGAG
jgi:hypothetical protein